MQIDSIKKYLASPVKKPYFLFIDDNQYASAINELSILGCDFVKMSDFCGNKDKLPDIDGLFTYFAYMETIDANADSQPPTA